MIIEIDKYKEKIIDYNPENSDDVHSASAKLADKDFEKYIKENVYTEIIFLSGGTASGKSEYAIQNYQNISDVLVLDGTLKKHGKF
jgi:adenosyl cobinamide kinase/adenosyl cobinamide phosphate guanylyltransferase